ncbi:hypothetical protein FW774_16065 [Pedobacter sp. BS3]|uniref:hypothetical protein n=1 Tax=Pedobacter sp. BS3 TaxID=2567937 RepID=UPI0011ED1B68|nr:hypothetical protein [Pedobacter sp. BS3]TZF82204.1 hypothetical protein FW774_16065 [Pedobacter sp. BS3]
MLQRFISLLTGRRCVYLIDFEGDRYISIIEKSTIGRTGCYVYWIARLFWVYLNEDGTCSDQSGYIIGWRYVD